MQITHKRLGDKIVIFIEGELGNHEAKQILSYQENIVSLYIDSPIVLNLSGLTFMDSSGLAVVVNLSRALERTGRKLAVEGTPQNAMKIFKAAGLNKKIEFIDGV